MPFPRRALIPCLALLLLGFGGPVRAAGTKSFEYTASQYVDLDPKDVKSANDERLTLALGDTLTMLDPKTGRAVPGVAERWETSADGKTWTFHLRADAVWSDAKPVRAQDFVYAWARTLEPNNVASPHQRRLFRAIQGGATILDGFTAMSALDELSKSLNELVQRNPAGIPADQVAQAIEDSGARPFAKGIEDKDVQRMLRWGDAPMPPDKAEAARKAVRAEKKKNKDAAEDALANFGKTVGAVAKDDHTLVVTTAGWRPYLPEILARSAFLPLRQDKIEHSSGGSAFVAGEFVGNGPFILSGRGPKPSEEGGKTNSSVEISRNPNYHGPAPAIVDRVIAWTDLGAGEDMRRFASKDVQWITNPARDLAKDLEKNAAYRTRPTGGVLYLVIRPDYVGMMKDKDGKEVRVRPFEKLEARKAFAMCVERGPLAKVCWPGADPAERIVPPGIRNAAPGVAAPKSNVAEATQAYASLGMKPDDFPWIDVYQPDDPDCSAIVEKLHDAWMRVLKVDSAGRVYPESEASLPTGGKYAMVMRERIGDWNDPSAYLEFFHSRDAASRTGWDDDALDAMLDGALDPAACCAAPDKALSGAQDAAGLKAKIEAAKAGTGEAKEALRLALLAEAEQRLLSQFVVVPLVYRRGGELLQDAKGLGEDEAWRNPAFVGALRSVNR